MPCGKFLNSAENCFGIGNPEKRQILMQGLQINFSVDFGDVEQSFHFRCECKLSAVMSIVERLHSKMVAGEKQLRPPRAQIANGKGEHAIEPLHAILAFLLVKVNH